MTGLQAGKEYYDSADGRELRKAHARHSRSLMRLYGLGLGGVVICAGVAYALGGIKKGDKR